MKAYPKGAPEISAAAKIATPHMGRLAYGPNGSSHARGGVNTESDDVNASKALAVPTAKHYGYPWCERSHPRPTTLSDKTCN
jgi:hypothetical protein